MDINKLNQLEKAIMDGEISRGDVLFAGANLIILEHPKRRRHDRDVFVVTPHAKELSWLVFQIKSIFEDEIDFMNKYGFYPEIGEAANEAIAAGADLPSMLLAVVERAKDLWSNRPKGLPRSGD